MEDRVSSVRRSVDRDCGGADHDGGMAGEGNHAAGGKSEFVAEVKPSQNLR